jgi:thiol-disulfide isomerase/thioredoxin
MQERNFRLDLFGRLMVAAAVASLALVTVTAIALARPGWRDAVGMGPRPAYATRSRIDVPPEVYHSTPFTIVLFARSTCAVCRSSVPFLARLVQEAAASGVAVRLVSSAPVLPAEVAFAQALGLGATELVGVDVRTLRVKQVPTVVLVDRAGDIRYAREGAVPAVDQDELLRTLSSLTRLLPIR